MSDKLEKGIVGRLSLEEMKAEALRRRGAQKRIGRVACGDCPLTMMCAKKQTEAADDCEGAGGGGAPSRDEMLRQYQTLIDDDAHAIVLAQWQKAPAKSSRISLPKARVANQKFLDGEVISDGFADLVAAMLGVRAIRTAQTKK